MVNLAEIKTHLRIEADFEDDDNYLESLISAAELNVKNTTGKNFEESNALYDLVVKMFVAHWYENRQPVSDKNNTDIPYTVECLINHLSLCGEYL